MRKKEFIAYAQPILQEKLPAKLSDLLELAIGDLESTLKTRQVDGLPGDIDMAQWIAIRSDAEAMPRCAVCLAGACVANRLDLTKATEGMISYGNRDLRPEHFGKDISHKMHALDALRTGHIQSALEHMDLDRPFGLAAQVQMPQFEADRPLAWLGAAKKIVDVLRLFQL